MQPIAARLGHQVDDASERIAVLGRHDAALHLELLDGIDRRADTGVSVPRSIVRAAVEGDATGRRGAAVHTEIGNGCATVAKPWSVKRVPSHVWRQQYKRKHGPAVYRQTGHARVLLTPNEIGRAHV